MNKRNTVRSVNQSCWPLSVSQSCYPSFPLSFKDDLPPNRCSESHRLFYFLPFQRLWMKCKASAAVPSARNCLCHCYFLARRWKMLRKQSAEPLGAPRLCTGWRYGVGPVLLELLSCFSAPCSLNPSPVLVGVCMATCSHRPLGQPGRQRAIAMVIRAQNLRKAVHCDWCALRWEEQNVTATGFFLFVVFAFNAHRGLFSLWFICAAVC